MMMVMMMNFVGGNWKRRSQLSFPWVITITLLTRLHLRPIISHDDDDDDDDEDDDDDDDDDDSSAKIVKSLSCFHIAGQQQIELN